jgi:hypothetical protein
MNIFGYPRVVPTYPSWWSSPSSEVVVSITTDDYPTRSETVLVSSLPSTNYYLPTNLVYYDDPIIYAGPVYNNVSYLDINGDKELQRKTTRYFYSQLYNVYVPESNSDILDFVKLNPRDVELVKSAKQANQNSTKKSEFAEKIKYLSENIFTKDDICDELCAYITANGINWWDLKKVSNNVERLLVKKLKERINEMLE